MWRSWTLGQVRTTSHFHHASTNHQSGYPRECPNTGYVFVLRLCDTTLIALIVTCVVEDLLSLTEYNLLATTFRRLLGTMLLMTTHAIRPGILALVMIIPLFRRRRRQRAGTSDDLRPRLETIATTRHPL